MMHEYVSISASCFCNCFYWFTCVLHDRLQLNPVEYANEMRSNEINVSSWNQQYKAQDHLDVRMDVDVDVILVLFIIVMIYVTVMY